MANAATATALQGGAMSNLTLRLMQNGFYPRRSGDILYCLQPNYYELNPGKVAQSGSAYNYDRHIPLVEELIKKEAFDAPKLIINKEVDDFYKFTPDSVKLENYVYNTLDKKIPVAI